MSLIREFKRSKRKKFIQISYFHAYNNHTLMITLPIDETKIN